CATGVIRVYLWLIAPPHGDPDSPQRTDADRGHHVRRAGAALATRRGARLRLGVAGRSFLRRGDAGIGRFPRMLDADGGAGARDLPAWPWPPRHVRQLSA